MIARVLPIGSAGSIGLAGTLVREGGLIAFPTDTVYGLGCDPLNEASVRRLFEVKARVGKPVPVLCLNRDVAGEFVRFNERALELTEQWPGALTIIAPLRRSVPSLLHQGTNWLGVRVPANEGCLALIRESGGYITGTSANLSGKPACRTAEEVRATIGERLDMILDGGRLHGVESTVVRVVGSSVEVLRGGGVSLEPGKRGNVK